MNNRNLTVIRAGELRRSMTLPEGLLWQHLRKRPQGFKFRRQHPLGSYIADFYCPAVKLVVEIDGQSHDTGDRPARDARRDGWMKQQGLRVIRFGAQDVMKDLEFVLMAVILACRE